MTSSSRPSSLVPRPSYLFTYSFLPKRLHPVPHRRCAECRAEGSFDAEADRAAPGEGLLGGQ